jgi:O-antigen/teichoic acid export membrane protein
MDLSYSLWGLAAISFVRFIWAILLINGYSRFRFSLSFAKDLLKHSGPLIAMTLISGSLPYIDGILVATYFDDTTFAVYRYGAREFPLTLLMANALSNAMVPEFANSNNRIMAFDRIKQQSLKLMHIFFPASIVMLFFSREIYPLVFNSDFITASSIFNILLLLIISRLVFPQTILLGYGKNKYLLLASSVEFVIKIIVSFALINSLGIFGIALATVFAFLSEKAFLIIVVNRNLHIRPSTYIPTTWLIFYSSLLIAAFIYSEFNVIFD